MRCFILTEFKAGKVEMEARVAMAPMAIKGNLPLTAVGEIVPPVRGGAEEEGMPGTVECQGMAQMGAMRPLYICLCSLISCPFFKPMA